MSVNVYKPHVVVVPEDDANRQLANGFALHPAVQQRALDIRPPAGGWTHVLDVFEQEYVPYLRKYPAGHVVLLLDFDEQGDGRRAYCAGKVPDELKPRVFLFGVRDNPEALRRDAKRPFETVGDELADGCRRGSFEKWENERLAHNLPEVQRMAPVVRPFLFP